MTHMPYHGRQGLPMLLQQQKHSSRGYEGITSGQRALGLRKNPASVPFSSRSDGPEGMEQAAAHVHEQEQLA